MGRADHAGGGPRRRCRHDQAGPRGARLVRLTLPAEGRAPPRGGERRGGQPGEGDRAPAPERRAQRGFAYLQRAEFPQRRGAQRHEAEVGRGDPLLEDDGERPGLAGCPHRDRQLVGDGGRSGLGSAGPQQGLELVPRVLVRHPVGRCRRPAASGQVGADHPVAVDGGVLGRQRRLQGAGRARLAHAPARPGTSRTASSSTGTCVASDAEMLANSWAREAEAPGSLPSMAVAAACSAARRKATAAAGAAGAAGARVTRADGDGDAPPAGTIRRDRSSAKCARCWPSSGPRAAVRVADAPAPGLVRPRSTAAYWLTSRCSAAIAACSRPTSGAGRGGVASTSTPPQPDTATRGSAAAAAISARRVGSARVFPARLRGARGAPSARKWCLRLLLVPPAVAVSGGPRGFQHVTGPIAEAGPTPARYGYRPGTGRPG